MRQESPETPARSDLEDQMRGLQGWAEGYGFRLIPLAKGTKRPVNEDWQKTDRAPDYRWIDDVENTDYNVGVLLGKDSGNLVDVDLDHPIARRMASLFLPTDTVRFGRRTQNGSYQTTHYLYVIEDDGKITRDVFVHPDPARKTTGIRSEPMNHQLRTDHGSTLIEIRGTGMQTVLPPSRYSPEVANDRTPVDIAWREGRSVPEMPRKISLKELRERIGQLSVAVVLALIWRDQEGQIHNMCLDFAGGCARSGIPYEVARDIVHAAATNAGEDLAGTKMQVRAVTDTYKSFEEGNTVTGWYQLTERLGPDISRAFQLWLGVSHSDLQFEPTDAYNASLLSSTFSKNIRWNRSQNSWYSWDGKRWAKDSDQTITKYAIDIGDKIRRDADAMVTLSEEEKEKRRKWGTGSRNLSRIKAIITLGKAEAGLSLGANSFDANPDLLNVQNGTIDLRTGTLLPHNRDDYISRVCPVDYDPHAVSLVWDRFVEQIMPDREFRLYMQRLIGYILTGHVNEEIIAIMYGPGGNGKSTFLEAIMMAIGEYAKTAAVSTFLKSSHSDGSRATSDIVALDGPRLVVTSEPDEGQRLNASIIKDISGGNAITARQLYGESFQFYPRFTLIIQTNHKPRVSAFDPGIWRRVRFLPFETMIPLAKQDRNLKKTITSPENLPAILAWAVQGCIDWYEHGLGSCLLVEMATQEYKLEMNGIVRFLREAAEPDPRAPQISAKQIRAIYNTWRKENGGEMGSLEKIVDALEELGYAVERKGAYVVREIRIDTAGYAPYLSAPPRPRP